MTSYKLEIEGVSKEYLDRGQRTLAVDAVELAVRDQEFVAILGPSGCGKSTLLRMVGGLAEPSAGTIRVDGREVTGPGPDRGMVFQSYTLFPWLTVRRNIEFGLVQKRVAGPERAAVVRRYLELTGLREFADAFPKQLSGGMKQRVAIARALANDPEMLLLDEPFGALDTQTRSLMQELLISIWDQFHKTILFVTHDVEEAIFLADRVVVMTARPGRIKDVFAVRLSRPRDYHVKTTPTFQELKARAVELVREESIRSALQPAVRTVTRN